MFAAEFQELLRSYGNQVAYYAISKGAMDDDEQWAYVTETWPRLNTMAVDTVLRHASNTIKAKFGQLMQDFA